MQMEKCLRYNNEKKMQQWAATLSFFEVKINVMSMHVIQRYSFN